MLYQVSDCIRRRDRTTAEFRNAAAWITWIVLIVHALLLLLLLLAYWYVLVGTGASIVEELKMHGMKRIVSKNYQIQL